MKFNKTLWLTVILVLGISLGFGQAAAKQTDEKLKTEAAADWKFHDIVSVDFVQQYVKIPPPEGVLIIDSRPKKAKYDKGHIPSAICIPDSQFDKMTAKLPQDKDTLLIFYCGGLK